MEVLRLARLIGIRATTVILMGLGALALVTIRALRKLSQPHALLDELRGRKMLWPWLSHSYKLLLGTVAYNAFVFLLIEPVLRRWFPPLNPWERVQGVFGSTRTTYEEIVPTVATALWIAGNAFVIVLLNRRLQSPRDVG